MNSILPGVDKFPDFLPLRNNAGRGIGLFSDYGSWLGIVWGTEALLEIRDTLSDDLHTLDLSSPLHRATSFPDRQEAELLDGSQLRIGFIENGTILLEISPPENSNTSAVSPPEVSCTLPFRMESVSDGRYWVLIGPLAQTCPTPPKDQFERNRQRWSVFFERAFSGMEMLDNPKSQVLMARGIATLLWNLRAPVKDLPHYGVIPSPFYYRGYWAWDSWKHAHALAYFAPELAAEQLRAQFFRQEGDGMVPDTVKPDPRGDNWRNSKPPMAAWALQHIWKQTQDAEVVRELYGKCAAQLEWWMKARRIPGEILFRAGGTDHLSATWETGWDISYRFNNIPLIPHGSWHLFDLWQPDLNTYLQNDFAAMANLAEVIGEDPKPWRLQADELAAAIRRSLWNEAKGCFCDARANSGASTGIISAATWLPLWAGIADDFQKQKVMKLMLSPSHFWTQVPFPTLSATEEEFDPNGFWDGSVWPDHASVAIQILGEDCAAGRDRIRDILFKAESYFECYSPLDGSPVRGTRPAMPQFSWGAASALEVLQGGPLPADRCTG